MYCVMPGEALFHHAIKRFGRHEAEYLTHKIAFVLEEFAKDSDPAADACVQSRCASRTRMPAVVHQAG